MANVTITDLPAAAAATLTQVFETVTDPSGTPASEKVTGQQIATLVQSTLGALAALNTVGTSQIDNDSVTYAKMQNVGAESRLLGRGAGGGAGDVQEVSLGSNLAMSGAALVVTGLGDVTGPGSSTSGAIAVFADGTGKVLAVPSGFIPCDGIEAGGFSLVPVAANPGGSVTLWSDTNASDALMYGDDPVLVGTQSDIELTAAPSDGVATGVKVTLTAAETLSFGEVCYINSSGRLALADADSTSTAPVVAMALDGAAMSAACPALTHGTVTNSGWAFTPGATLYLSTTPGDVTETAPSGSGDVVQVLGVALAATTILFTPSLSTVVRA